MKLCYPLIAILLLSYACQKTNTGGSNSGGGSGQVAITPKGTPVGTPITKTIGAAGGTIISSDSMVELDIPAGALAGDVPVTIQPLTNEAPGGIGLSYDLLPNGTVFSTPATLKFHYIDDSLSGTLPELLWIVYQDSANAWQTDLESQDFDTVAKIISIDINHFSARAIVPELYVINSKTILLANQEATLTAVLSGVNKNKPAGEMMTFTRVPDGAVHNWKLTLIGPNNPAAGYGSISGSGASVTYHSPGSINERILVEVTVDVGPVVVWQNSKKTEFAKVNIPVFLLLKPSEFNYSVSLWYQDNEITGYTGQLYIDHASFDMTITLKKGDPPDGQDYASASISNIQNHPPTVTPSSETYPLPDGTSVTINWIPDDIGLTNIQSVLTPNEPFDDVDSGIALYFQHSNAINPGFTLKSSANNATTTVPATVLPSPTGLPAVMPIFFVNHKAQSYGNSSNGEYVQILPK
jgi:hypothetical protein